VSSKLCLTDYGRDKALRGFGVSLRKLGFDYIDLCLLHWPMPTDFRATVAAYKDLGTLVSDGLVRAIGVSNFSQVHLKALIAETSVEPAVNQVKLNPFFVQSSLREFRTQHNIVPEAWFPIGEAYTRNPKAAPETATSPLVHPTVLKLAEKYKKTPA
jgi:diketogulonate reductase-like aldo/keto reductase